MMTNNEEFLLGCVHMSRIQVRGRETASLRVQVMLNPLRDPDAKITSPKFHSAIVHLAKRMFNV